MGKILTNHKKMFLKGKQRATYPEFDRDDWAFEEILGEKNSLWLKMSQPVAEPPPWQTHGVQNYNKTWLLFSLVWVWWFVIPPSSSSHIWRTTSFSDPRADLKVYSYVRYTVLVDALSTNIQGFEKPSWSKKQSLRRKSPHTCPLFKAYVT